MNLRYTISANGQANIVTSLHTYNRQLLLPLLLLLFFKLVEVEVQANTFGQQAELLIGSYLKNHHRNCNKSAQLSRWTLSRERDRYKRRPERSATLNAISKRRWRQRALRKPSSETATWMFSLNTRPSLESRRRGSRPKGLPPSPRATCCSPLA